MSQAIPGLSLPVNPEVVQTMQPLPRPTNLGRGNIAHDHPALRSTASWSFDGVPHRRQGEPSHAAPQDHPLMTTNPLSNPSRSRRHLPLDPVVPPTDEGLTPATTTYQSDSVATSDQHQTATRRRRRPNPNPFGTREELESENYSSPVADLFGRAWNRYREVQEGNRARRFEEEERRRNGDVSLLGTGPPTETEVEIQEMAYQRAQATLATERRRLMAMGILQQPPRVNPIDQQISRPSPLQSEEMRLDMSCKICCEQKVDTLLEPCMHLAICHWCSEIVRQRAHQRRHNRVGPRTGDDEDRWKCPICRRDVMQSRRVYLA